MDAPSKTAPPCWWTAPIEKYAPRPLRAAGHALASLWQRWMQVEDGMPLAEVARREGRSVLLWCAVCGMVDLAFRGAMAWKLTSSGDWTDGGTGLTIIRTLGDGMCLSLAVISVASSLWNLGAKVGGESGRRLAAMAGVALLIGSSPMMLVAGDLTLRARETGIRMRFAQELSDEIKAHAAVDPAYDSKKAMAMHVMPWLMAAIGRSPEPHSGLG